MKTFTLASAIDTGKWTPNDRFMSGSYTVFDRTIRDHNRYGWGPITYLEGFQRSANTGMAHLLTKIGDDVFIDYLIALVLGTKRELIYRMKRRVLFYRSTLFKE